jgi:rubrerythrin
MSIRFNADEILGIAEDIERNAESFYENAANLVADREAAKILHDLSSWEKRHEEVFAAMRQGLSEQERESTAYDPYDELALYIKAVADGKIFNIYEDALKLLGAKPSLDKICELALAREKESVVFYTAMKELVPPKLGKDAVEKVIREELGHIAILNQGLTSIKK